MSSSRNTPEVVVITGATAGVGKATTRAFARRGASIALLARDPDRLETTKREVEELGGRAIAIPTDVANFSEVERATEMVENTLGPIDIWINNAMVSVFAQFQRMLPEEFERVTQVTYLGTVFGTMCALKRMRLRNRGTVVQVGSALARRSIPLQSAYCGAKHAIEGFTDSVRTELMHDKSRVKISMIQLPAVNTPQFDWVRCKLPYRPQPVPPIYQPEVIAEGIYWLAHHYRRELYVGGSTLAVMELNKFFPGIGDKYLAKVGFNNQQTLTLALPNRPDNLWEPVPGNWSAHGRFDLRATAKSYQLWFTTHRMAVGICALVAVGVWVLGRL